MGNSKYIYEASNINDVEKFTNDVAEKILQQNMSLFLGAGSSMQYGTMN